MDEETADEMFSAEFIETDMSDLCRICGSTSDTPLIPMFEETGLAEDLVTKIMLYLPIKISEEDALPIKACVNCTNGVLTWHLLYECCVDADRRFQTMLSEEMHVQTKPKKKQREHILSENDIPKDDADEKHLIQEQEMEDVMFLKAEFGPEDEQYLEDETNLGDGELEQTDNEKQPINVDNCNHLLFCYTCLNSIENDESQISFHIENAPNDCDIRCKMCELSVAISACDVCDEKFTLRADMISHRSNHKYICCNICSKVFKNYASMAAHKKNHNENLTIHKCPICECESYRKYNIQLHIKSHVNDHFCKICSNSYNSKQMLENHKAIHNKLELAKYHEFDMKVSCDKCESKHDSKFKLYFHTIKEHNNDDERFTCPECDRMFESVTMLRSHEKTHTGQHYECEECGKTFSKLKNYKEHQNIHLDSRPFECDVCFQRFIYSSNLSQHRKIHKADKNFACHYCDKKFTRSNTLNTHLKSHRNERNFACEFCNRSFVQSSTLKKHKKALHRKCESCGKIVGDRKQWQIHRWKECVDSTKPEPDEETNKISLNSLD